MSNRKTILRYFHILTKLRKAPASFKQIDAYLQQQSELQEENFTVSKRQFARVIDDIRSIFELDIDYDPHRDVYFIDEDEESDISQRRLEAYDTFQALKVGENTSKIIHFEKHHPQGTENMLGLIQAIKSKQQVGFTYQKFWEHTPTQRLVEPFALKEFKSRWYLVARDKKDEVIKTFALDRLSKLETKGRTFAISDSFRIDLFFQNCFGIITPDNGKPEEIILSFAAHQGKYIKTLPLHESQKILVDNEKELKIKLKLFITYDFLLEILSHGDQVKVIRPEKLLKQITVVYQNALKQYNNGSAD